MAATGWSIAGRRVEVKPALPSGKLVVDGETAFKLKSKGEFPLSIDGRSYTFERKPGLMAPKDTLRAPDGRAVPPTPKHVPLARAEAGSLCAQHADRPARIVCPRCGSYACDACSGADATHCEACTQRLVATAEKQARDLVFMAPAFFFIVMGGAIGAMLGFAAGAAAVAVARR